VELIDLAPHILTYPGRGGLAKYQALEDYERNISSEELYDL
jgi:hypothetical protein